MSYADGNAVGIASGWKKGRIRLLMGRPAC
jgi:hypothetical protein